MKKISEVLPALLYSLAVPAFGFFYLGGLVAILFLIGYLGGFAAWLISKARPSWKSIRLPYWATLLVFLLLHKTEERVTGFFEVISAKITGMPVPEFTVPLVIGLLVLPIGGWLVAPFLIKRSHELGYFFAWTLFFSMGVTELAHFVFPFLIDEPYGYFPGMYSVIILAPLAWWGMWRLLGKPMQRLQSGG